MIFPAIAEMEKNAQSRYGLVIMIAKRARQIAEKAEKEKIDLSEKPVTIAVNEIASGRVSIRDFSNEEPDHE